MAAGRIDSARQHESDFREDRAGPGPQVSAQTFAQLWESMPGRSAGGGTDVAIPVTITKASGDDQRIIYGWASISTVSGQHVVDCHNHILPVVELEKAAHAYVQDCRAGKRQHKGAPVLSLVESVVFSKAKQDALGIDLGREGWFGGWQVAADAWPQIKQDIADGKLTGLSIAGTAVEVPIQEAV